MALEEYHRKRDFGITPEPRGKLGRRRAAELGFVIQKHRASHLHYDFRLELDGVLLSWAVPKGPSLDPAVKRLAMQTEDHPIEYGAFEGVIPAGEYGGGTVMLWDRGVWIPEGDPRAGYRSGKLGFELRGEKLRGRWKLVRSWKRDAGEKRSWLLMKADDEHADRARDIAVEAPLSVATGRDLEAIAADEDAVWHSNRSVAQNVARGALARGRDVAPKPAPAPAAAKKPGLRGKRAKLPDAHGAQLCTLVKRVPNGPEWVHEIKYDGYRMLARLEKGRCTIVSRNGKDWTDALEPVARAVEALPAKSLWIDGEVVVLLPDGRTSFQALQNALGGDAARLRYIVFDLLHLDGEDLTELALVERKARLAELLAEPGPLIRYGEHFSGDAEAFYALACEQRLEGVVSKQKDAPYRARRGASWVKTKCTLRQELVVGGWTDPGGSRTGFGALLLGAHDAQGALRYVGKVGTGFDTKTLGEIHARLRKLERDAAPFVDPPRGAEARGAHWAAPTLVAEIEFTEWTKDGTARHPSFKGLRLDKRAREVVFERPVDVEAIAQAEASPMSRLHPIARARAQRLAHRQAREPEAPRARRSPRTRPAARVVTLTNPDKLLFPEAGIRKADVAAYYRAVGEHMLPHLEGRPLTLVRCPNGWGSKCFYQKHVKDGTPEILTRVPIREDDGTSLYMAADSVEAIVALLQMGVLEIHPWGSRQPTLDRPDRIIFDFDPDEGLGWREVVDAAKLLRKALEKIGLECFLKTTGGKGLHVVLPIEPTLPWEPVKAFTKAVAESFAGAFPDRFTAKLAKASRGRRIFVDYLRNAEGATAVAPYSVRAKRNAPVATPIHWRELKDDLRHDHFNLENVPARLARLRSDPWEDFERTRQRLTTAMFEAVGLDLAAFERPR